MRQVGSYAQMSRSVYLHAAVDDAAAERTNQARTTGPLTLNGGTLHRRDQFAYRIEHRFADRARAGPE